MNTHVCRLREFAVLDTICVVERKVEDEENETGAQNCRRSKAGVAASDFLRAGDVACVLF